MTLSCLARWFKYRTKADVRARTMFLSKNLIMGKSVTIRKPQQYTTVETSERKSDMPRVRRMRRTIVQTSLNRFNLTGPPRAYEVVAVSWRLQTCTEIVCPARRPPVGRWISSNKRLKRWRPYSILDCIYTFNKNCVWTIIAWELSHWKHTCWRYCDAIVSQRVVRGYDLRTSFKHYKTS